MEQKREAEQNDLLPKRGNPLHETVTYKVGGTLYEVSTICGGSELLYDKMERLIKAESVISPTDKTEKIAIIKITTCLSGIHYRRNEHMTTTNYPDNITALYARLSQEDALDGESKRVEIVWNFIGALEQDEDKQTLERQRKSRTAKPFSYAALQH